MGLKIIDEKTLERIKDKILILYAKTKKMRVRESLDDWLDNQDVCQLLDISLRTLQSYRDRGILPFSIIGHKCYYKNTDVSHFLETRKMNK